ncbi:YfaZ family outer membrane protein [Shigella flexneri]
MLLVSASVNAMSIGQAGKEFADIGVGFGTESTSMALSGNWTHNDDDGDVAGVGWVEFAYRAVMATVGKAFTPTRITAMKVYAAAVGGGLQWKIGERLPFVGEYYYSPDWLSSGIRKF